MGLEREGFTARSDLFNRQALRRSRAIFYDFVDQVFPQPPQEPRDERVHLCTRLRNDGYPRNERITSHICRCPSGL
jgi:hypothetical protein